MKPLERPTRTLVMIKKCPHCDKKNVTHGHVMGHLGLGKKKMFGKDHLQFLSKRMSKINEQRKIRISIGGRKKQWAAKHTKLFSR